MKLLKPVKKHEGTEFFQGLTKETTKYVKRGRP